MGKSGWASISAKSAVGWSGRVQSTTESAVISPQATPREKPTLSCRAAGARPSSATSRTSWRPTRRPPPPRLAPIQRFDQSAGFDLAHEAVVDGVGEAELAGARVRLGQLVERHAVTVERRVRKAGVQRRVVGARILQHRAVGFQVEGQEAGERPQDDLGLRVIEVDALDQGAQEATVDV